MCSSDLVVTDPARENTPCRVYAPVGSHEDLLPYLVRRLLENGANTSFVNRIVDARLPASEVVADPVAFVEALPNAAHPRIPLPVRLYGAERDNSNGFNFADGDALQHLASAAAAMSTVPMAVGPRLGTRTGQSAAPSSQSPRAIFSPVDGTVVGRAVEATEAEVGEALSIAVAAFGEWESTPAAERARIDRKSTRLNSSHT